MATAAGGSDGHGSGTKAPVTFRLGDLEPQVLRRRPDGRALGAVVRRDLHRYYRVLRDSLRHVRLSPEEAHCVVMALRGHDLDGSSYRFLWAEVEQRVRENRRAFVPEGCDTELLLEGLRRLPPGALRAVLDAADLYWERVAERSSAEPALTTTVDAALLYEVGLLRAYVDA
jgi:hypothetical protein